MDHKSNSGEDYDPTSAMIYMIDITIIHLNGLRTECVLSEELTQMEIRSVETKLIRLFGEQSIQRQIALSNKDFSVPPPQLLKWLNVVGLKESLIKSIIMKIGDDFDVLLNLSQEELNNLTNEMVPDEKRRLLSAMNNLKLFIDKSKLNDPTVNELDLYWDSWDKSTTINNFNDNSTSASNYLQCNTDDLSENRSSCPTSPLDSSKKLIINSQEQLDVESTSKSSSSKEFKPSSTPPPFHQKNLINYSNHKLPVTPSSYKTNNNQCIDTNFNPSMPKSKSHEEHLTNKIEKTTENFDTINYRRRLESEPCTDTKLNNSFSNSKSPPIASPDNYNTQSDSCFFEEPQSLTNSFSNVNAPRSPRTQGMKHTIPHSFTTRIRPKKTNCNLCGEQMMFGYRCKHCKYRCHKECVKKVPASCGLPPELLSIFKETYNSSRQSPISSSSTLNPINQTSQTPQCSKFKKAKPKSNKRSSPDSSSNVSSRNSTAPSSPIQANNVNNNSLSASSSNKTFTFNNIDEKSYSVKTKNNIVNKPNDLHNNNQPETSLTNNDNLDSLDSTTNRNLAIRLNSQDSQISVDYDDQTGDRPWPRQNSLTMKEWNIPFDEVIKEKKIGTGRFGTVFKGKWHGSVAIKMFNIASGLDDRNALEAFRTEVATFRKTRHENLVLFMGVCTNPPHHLAIVTSYCKGYPLYSHLYERKEKFNLNRIISIGRQISQGMGYLHARGIVHKDLRSKNIFYDNSNSKVVIADFGFFSLTKLCFSNDKHKDRLEIPKGWLCYLAPELMKSLKAGSNREQDDLPFSFSTDIFSFGTIWHELMFGFLPFEGEPAEVVIWQVGKGIKQSLINLQASKEIKEILMKCWAYKPNDRPSFSKLVETFSNLPKKRLQRSPSHPIQLMANKHLY